MLAGNLIQKIASERHVARNAQNNTRAASISTLANILITIWPRSLTSLHPRLRKSTRCCGGLRKIVATSEHWYEEEEEFDSITDALTRKILVIVSAPYSIQASEHAASFREYLQPLPFVCGFCGKAEADFAAALWQGREKPPLFLKMRARAALNGGTDAPIEDFLSEILQQNWRVELDAGLGVKEPEVESIMVVCSAAAAEKLLLECCTGIEGGGGGGGDIPPGTVSIINVAGTAAGDPAEWKLLTKQTVMIGKVPSAGEYLTVDAVKV